jgi:hypothetical protein
MSDFANPYQSPESASVPEKTPGARGMLTDLMLRYLKEASPWLRFLGIMGFIGCGLSVGGCLIIALVVGFSSAVASAFSEGFLGGAFPGWIFSVLYAVLGLIAGVVGFFPSRFLYSFGSGIRNYFVSGREQDLETALRNNKSFWKFCGIACIIYLAFIPVTTVIVIIGSITAAMGGFLG